MLQYFLGLKLSSFRMFRIITVKLRVTLKTDRDCIINCVRAAFCSGHDVVNFHLHTTESMADTTTPMAADK